MEGKTIPIYVDPIGLQMAARTLQSTVQVDLEGVPLKSSLRRCLQQLGLVYGVEDGFLLITSDELILPRYDDPFRVVGHCLLALIAAGIGGLVVPLAFGPRRRTPTQIPAG
jgi:hypothetical protein